MHAPVPLVLLRFEANIIIIKMLYYNGNDEQVTLQTGYRRQCPSNYTCIPGVGPNPDYGYTNYDNIGWGLVMAFQILTMDYWENLYNKVWLYALLLHIKKGLQYVFLFIYKVNLF